MQRGAAAILSVTFIKLIEGASNYPPTRHCAGCTLEAGRADMQASLTQLFDYIRVKITKGTSRSRRNNHLTLPFNSCRKEVDSRQRKRNICAAYQIVCLVRVCLCLCVSTSLKRAHKAKHILTLLL